MSNSTPIKTNANKARAAAIVTAITAIAAGVETIIPDPNVKVICQLVTLVAGAVGTVLAVYWTTNNPIN